MPIAPAKPDADVRGLREYAAALEPHVVSKHLAAHAMANGWYLPSLVAAGGTDRTRFDYRSTMTDGRDVYIEVCGDTLSEEDASHERRTPLFLNPPPDAELVVRVRSADNTFYGFELRDRGFTGVPYLFVVEHLLFRYISRNGDMCMDMLKDAEEKALTPPLPQAVLLLSKLFLEEVWCETVGRVPLPV